MSRVLVTGGAGAIGSHLVAALVERGDDVVVLDDLSSGRRDLVPEAASLVVGAVEDSGVVEQAMAGVETVAHLAALFANQNSIEHPERDLRVSGLGTLNVLEQSRRAGVHKVLVVSSSCVYSNVELATEEALGRVSDTPYAITKGLVEDYARYYASQHGMQTVIVRPFNSYGPHEYPGPFRNVIPNFLALAMRGEELVVTGTGGETRDFTYVDDIVRGMVLALVRPTPPGEAYNLGSGRSVRIDALAELVNELTGNRAGYRCIQRRSWDQTMHRRASIEKAGSVLGYEPLTKLEDGLERTYAWLSSVL